MGTTKEESPRQTVKLSTYSCLPLADTAGEVREILQVLNQHARDYHLLMLEI
jgi:gamma-glutamyl:cysteine ligase YbdK (ATP-grasp superfamily)